ncbi:helix-turn-helix domain-containing protein [Paenibacillus sp. PDC88]|uniref:helix-turn-helix domain-containing protein n=1 Tax=Paenibacillus sp. PDC88 TaxID=1884375 RepID=UPI000896DC5D|nr:helix-turn-helix domain-containing protein [Paenibacillus sp. PDC88]SDX58866.1 AraC-type DNA-binding protein [Paenibacillus sp. PDC88]
MPTYMMHLLRFSLLLGLIPVLTMGFLSYYIAAGDVEQKVLASNTQLLRRNEQQIDDMLKGLERSTLQLANSPLMKQALQENWTPAHFQEIREMSSALSNLQTPVMTSEAYFIHLGNGTVTGLDRFQSLDQFKDRDLIMKYASHASSLFMDTSSSEIYTTWVQKIPLFPMRTGPKGLIVVKMPKKHMAERLSKATELGSQYIIDAKGRLILGFIPDSWQKELDSAVNTEVLSSLKNTGMTKQSEAYSFRTQVDGAQYNVIFLYSASYGWTHVSVTSVEAMTKQTQHIAWITAMVSGVVLVVIFVTAYIWSRRMYKPIHRLVEYSRQTDIGPDQNAQPAGLNELHYIEQSIRRLSSSRTELQAQLSTHTEHMSESLMLMLLSNRIQADEFVKRSSRCGFPKSWQALSVMKIQIDTFHLSKYDEHNLELLLYAINNMVAELISPASRFAPVILDHAQVTLLIEPSNSAENAQGNDLFYQTAVQLKDKIESYLQLQISIGLSRSFLDLSAAPEAYMESASALRQRMVPDAGCIIRYTPQRADHSDGRTPYAKLREIEEHILYSLRKREQDQLSLAMELYLNEITENRAFQPELNILLIKLAMRIIETAQTQELELHLGGTLSGEKLLSKLTKLNTKEDIRYWFEQQLFMPVIHAMEQQAEEQQVRIASRMLEMIHSRFDQDITLESCAAELNYHPFYLSRVFKKDVGMPFSEYLTSYRMSQAKLLLENTSLLVSDIGRKLKYANTSAFIRTFRKWAGMTPGQYREQYERSTVRTKADPELELKREREPKLEPER